MTPAVEGQLGLIALIGPPGSGKTTQALAIEAILGVPALAVAGWISDATRPYGNQPRDGSLAPDQEATCSIQRHLESRPSHRGYVLDGFPRTRTQADYLIGLALSVGISKALVIILEPRCNTELESRLRLRQQRSPRVDGDNSIIISRLATYEAEKEGVSRALENPGVMTVRICASQDAFRITNIALLALAGATSCPQ